MPYPDFGKRNAFVTIYQDQSNSVDAAGAPVPKPTAIGRGWAEIKTLTGNALWQAQQTYAEVTHRITFDYTPLITRQCTVSWMHRAFQINAVLDPDEDRSQLVCLCKELVS